LTRTSYSGVWWALVAALAVVGAVVGLGRGQLPRASVAQNGVERNLADRRADTASAALPEQTAPDLQLYREVVAEVRKGRGYYEVARERLPAFGFPIRSPLNWRLPTYAWLFAWAPGPLWIQGMLVALSTAGLSLAFVAERRRHGPLAAIAVTLLLIGAVRWALDGHAYYAQEVWAATLILISLSAYSLGWRTMAIVAGVMALGFRELALPYCLVAAALAMWKHRWWEAAGWTTGIALFFAFFAWHIGQVNGQLAGLGAAGGTDLAQWLRAGGLDFVLLTERMNGLFFAAPAVALWAYLLASMLGLASRTDDASRLACGAALLYVLAYALLGRPENFYWGLLYAPLLPWGIGSLVGWVSSASLPSAFDGDETGSRGRNAAEGVPYRDVADAAV
jgi:hypothetical protein